MFNGVHLLCPSQRFCLKAFLRRQVFCRPIELDDEKWDVWPNGQWPSGFLIDTHTHKQFSDALQTKSKMASADRGDPGTISEMLLAELGNLTAAYRLCKTVDRYVKDSLCAFHLRSHTQIAIQGRSMVFAFLMCALLSSSGPRSFGRNLTTPSTNHPRVYIGDPENRKPPSNPPHTHT